MSSDITPEVIKLTQESLGEFVKKPALSEKLLRKPPFRFLHDVITAVQKSTGFFDGLFTDEELISENVKDRESKIAFLNKVIDVVNIVTDSSLTVRSSKIIAGLEPDKTNELLQQLGVALRQNQNENKAVDTIPITESTKKSNKTNPKPIESNSKPIETNSKQPKNNLSKKPPTDAKSSKNISNKVNTKPKNVSKDKGKTDTASDSDKASVKSNKSDIARKPKVKEKTTTKTKASKNVEKQTTDKNKQLIANELSTDSNDVTPSDVYGKRVELKDILGDSDDLTSMEPEINNLENKQQNELNNQSNERRNSVEQIEENPVKNNPVSRPQSRLTRQRSNLVAINDNETVENEKESKIATEPVVENNNHIEKIDRIKQIDSQDAATDRGSGDTKTRSVRTASSKKSAKVRSEPFKADHSISLESKSDNDIMERKPLASELDTGTRQARLASANLRPPSVRPSSARPGAPRLKEKNVDVILTPSEPVVIGKVHVIVENYENQPEDDEGGVEVLQIAPDDNLISEDNTDTKMDTKGHGFLVQQILETQKELSNDENSKVEIEWEYGSRREREASYKEIEGIRNGLQLLSRASNPLGKLMDYIQEDVEVMRQELMQWRDTRVAAAMELKQQQSLTEEQIQPLQAKLIQIENNINEQVELIYTVKSNIHRNTQKIMKLIDGEE